LPIEEGSLTDGERARKRVLPGGFLPRWKLGRVKGFSKALSSLLVLPALFSDPLLFIIAQAFDLFSLISSSSAEKWWERDGGTGRKSLALLANRIGLTWIGWLDLDGMSGHLLT